MTVLTYFARQRERIREKHDGETYLFCGGECVITRPAQEILDEINALDGLNAAQRDLNEAVKARRKSCERA